MARSASAAGAAVYGPIDQGDFLRAHRHRFKDKGACRARYSRPCRGIRAGAGAAGGQVSGRNGRFVQDAWWSATAGSARRPGSNPQAPNPHERGSIPDRGIAGIPGSRTAFSPAGGVSQGVYASLNGGVGSRDAPEAVTENRARIAAALGTAPERLAVPFQIHSPDAVAIIELWPASARPRCDALVTATPGLALGVTGADCGMILFADQRARVIGAAHAGWKGALTGVVEATVTAMERLGARRSDIVAALGPCIDRRSYEVGPEFVAAFEGAGRKTARYFVPSRRAGHSMFDLNAYIAERAARAGVGRFEDLRLDTYADERRFFSYRRATHRKEPDYGRLLSVIAMN